MDLLLKGLVTGFILSIMIGPVFFVLLETSIRKGIKAAIALDVGVLISDLVYILIAYVFYTEVQALSQGDDKSLLHLIGGGLFAVYGVYNLLKKVKETKVKNIKVTAVRTIDYIWLGLKGFILNIANPLVVFYWFSVMTFGAEDAGGAGGWKMIFYLGVILITFFAIDLLKIFGAKRLRPLVTPGLLVGLNRLIGIVFIVFGVVLIVQGILGMK
ncbi:MAG: threonine/homoserine/homoserine lactone efflux protein [Flavobacteriaceae bacterium]|jgi:threonine/homoserine/homoserine lactone efflux protein